MTKTVHLAGTDADLASATYISNTWKSQNFDYVKIIDYDVLLSYPDESIPNS